jgi:hypothetical protein
MLNQVRDAEISVGNGLFMTRAVIPEYQSIPLIHAVRWCHLILAVRVDCKAGAADNVTPAFSYDRNSNDSGGICAGYLSFEVGDARTAGDL